MLSRRKFSALLANSLLVAKLKSCTMAAPSTFPQDKVIISTWSNEKANNMAMQILETTGMSVIDAIEEGINMVEADPNDRSVGYGGRPDREGNVTLDACIMNSKGQAGSVTYLEGIQSAISVARRVMEKTPHVILSGNGAQQFALEEGFELKDLLTPETKLEYQEWLKKGLYEPKINIESHDTIGMLASDDYGQMCGGCSTSGLAYKMMGRVGDSPIIGAGLYVDNEVGSAVATGLGELVLRKCSSFLVVEFMRSGMSANEACKAAIQRIVASEEVKNAQVGLVALEKSGIYGAYSIHPGFQYTVTKRGQTSKLASGSYFK